MELLTILDYSTSKVFIYDIPYFENSEDTEIWIDENTELKLSQIHYMTSNSNVQVIYNNKEQQLILKK